MARRLHFLGHKQPSLGCPIQNEEYTEMKNLVYLAIVAALAMGFVAVEMGYT